MRCPRNTLYLRLKGRGVQPVISLSVEDGLLDLGDALVGDTISSSFKVRKRKNLLMRKNIFREFFSSYPLQSIRRVYVLINLQLYL